MKHDLTEYAHGIYALDSDYLREQLAAVHLIHHQGRLAIIDTGTFKTLPHVLNALKTLGAGPGDVDYVMLTHIHLDHAGGAGVMMEAFPRAQLVVHPRGARHMASPAQLMAGVEAVYGKARTRELYGEILPIPAARIIEAPDNTALHLADRPLLCLDTPGHARHHIVIYDAESNGMFTGDMLGISYPALSVNDRPFVFPTTTPSQFDPSAMRQSVERILALQPEAAYLTHFGLLPEPQRHAAALLRRLDAFVSIAKDAARKVGADETTALQGGRARNALLAVADGDTAIHALQTLIAPPLRAFLIAEARAHGVSLTDDELDALLGMDVDLNAQGLALWVNTATA